MFENSSVESTNEQNNSLQIRQSKNINIRYSITFSQTIVGEFPVAHLAEA